MKNVLLIGEIYSTNLGDGLIFEVVKALLNKNNDINFIELDLSGKYEYNNSPYVVKDNSLKLKYFASQHLSFIPKIIRKKSKSSTQSLFNYYDDIFENNSIEAIVFAGGQMFLDFFIPRINHIIKHAENKNIPVFFNACGYGKLSESNSRILKDILNNAIVKKVSVRDHLDQVRTLRQDVIYSPDTAIASSQVYAPVEKKYKLGLGIMHSNYQPIGDQILFWKKLIKNIERQNISWRVFVNGSKNDYELAHFVLKSLELDPNYFLSSAPRTPNELISTITQFENLISMRLHSLIAAYSYKIPTTALAWDDKVKSFYTLIGNNNSCFSLRDNPKAILDSYKANASGEFNYSKHDELIKSIEDNIDNLIETISSL